MFCYTAEPATNMTTNATPNTATANGALRQATRAFFLAEVRLIGKSSAATTLSGIVTRFRRWTTVGTGGTAVTPEPSDDRAPACATTAAFGTPTAGTVSGVQKLVTGCGKASPGGWVARTMDARVGIDAGTADELGMDSSSGEASLPYEVGVGFDE